MKKWLVTTAVILIGLGSQVQAEFPQSPDHTFMWSRFNSIDVIDSFALATTDFGVVLLSLNSVTGHFDPINELLLNTQPVRARVGGDRAIVQSAAGLTYFVDLSNLPELSLIGEADLGASVYDFAVSGDDLYLACGFRGLRHYRFNGEWELEFIDSSLVGVHSIQVAMRGEDLLLLDDYNGVLRFDLSAHGIETVDNILKVPRRVQSFLVVKDTLVLPLVNQPLIYHGVLGAAGGELFDSTFLAGTPDQVFVVDTFLVAIENHQNLMEVISTRSGSRMLIGLRSLLKLEPNGDTYYRQNDPHLLLISDLYGLASFDLRDIWFDYSPRQAFSRPGPITALEFHGDRLATGGDKNPIDLFYMGENNRPVYDTTFFGLDSVGNLVDAGEVLFAHFPSVKLISALRFAGDSIETISSISEPNFGTSFMKYYEYPPSDSLSLLLVVGYNYVDVLGVSDDWQISRAEVAHTLDEEILDVIVVDNYLLVSTTDRLLHCFLINNNLSITSWLSVATRGSLQHLTTTGPREAPDGSWSHPSLTFGFDNHDMYEILLGSDGFPSVAFQSTLPVDVVRTARGGTNLFTIGNQGLGRLDLSYEVPRMEEYGGYGGHLIAFGDSTLATSDGTAIHLYSFRNPSLTPDEGEEPDLVASRHLRPNYPNPFNPRTQIDFYLPEPATVEVAVYNVLGRKLVSLVDRSMESGLHSIDWDGTDQYGHRVASGVYFYRMTTPTASETRKMVLLK